MKLLNFNIIKLTLSLIFGILIGHYFNFSLTITFSLVVTCVLFLCVSYVFTSKTLKSRPWFGIAAFLCIVAIGILIIQVQDKRLKPSHYLHSDFDSNQSHTVVLKIRKRLKPDSYNYKFIADVVAMDNGNKSGNILVNLSKDSLITNLNVDEIYATSVKLNDIQKPLNPYQFDYNEYLKKRQIYHQVYLKSSELIKVATDVHTFFGFADRFRLKVNTQLRAFGFKPEALSIINALLLGQRQDIDATTYNNYIDAGVIHILAVSGLHVGIILIMLNIFLKPLIYLKNGRTLKLVLIVMALWTFAIISGLSPSVTRAVTMFSVIALAMHLKRPTNIYNTLTISAFLILLFEPMYLFDVGFQMSYLAVIAIVSIQPLLYKLWIPKLWVFDKLWQIFTVTLAAQFGVVPISLYYFHQFPGLFFISNIVIIPFLGLILGLGVLIIGMALLNFLPRVLVDTYSYILESLNAFIAWIAQFENFLFRDISFSIAQVFIAYFIVLSGLRYFKHKTFNALTLIIVNIAIFIGVIIWNNYETSYSEFIVFNKSRNSIIGFKTGKVLNIHSSLPDTVLKIENAIKNYKIGAFVNSVNYDTIHNAYSYKDRKILIVDSLGVYNVKLYKPEIIILRNSPKINLARVIDSLKPIIIIADASNYKSYIERWKATCLDKKIPFHSTYEKGSYTIVN